MQDKFILTPDGGVGFDGAMGVANLTNEEVVKMLNGFNAHCQKLEDEIKNGGNNAN